MNHFCLLKDIESYVAHDWDLVGDDADCREYWLDLFANHFEEVMGHALHRYGRSVNKQIAKARGEFTQLIAELRRNPTLHADKLNILELCRLREKALRDNNLGDPFKHIKDRENAAAIALYSDVVHQRHVMPAHDRWLLLIRSVFAGNIFDLGSPATMEFSVESPDFEAVLNELPDRPWVIDDFDRLMEDLPTTPLGKWSKAVVFADNAGSDFILGVMPLVRELALAGTQIVLAINELPTLNDLTIDETIDIVERLAMIDDDLSALIDGKMLSIISSGNDIPLIDLSQSPDELNEAAADADLVILEGMGRAIESNFDAEFKVDCLRLALLKDEKIAARIGGRVYDCVCKYTPVQAPTELTCRPTT